MWGGLEYIEYGVGIVAVIIAFFTLGRLASAAWRVVRGPCNDELVSSARRYGIGRWGWKMECVLAVIVIMWYYLYVLKGWLITLCAVIGFAGDMVVTAVFVYVLTSKIKRCGGG